MYVDDIKTIAKKYVSSINAFWFDIATSLPWSYLDYYAYRVGRCPSRGCFIDAWTMRIQKRVRLSLVLAGMYC